jgi:hypothetical protein
VTRRHLDSWLVGAGLVAFGAMLAVVAMTLRKDSHPPRFRPYRITTRVHGVPAHWPCRAVRVAVAASAPRDANRLLGTVVPEVRDASGVAFDFAGEVSVDFRDALPPAGWETSRGHVDVLVVIGPRPPGVKADELGIADVRTSGAELTAALVHLYSYAGAEGRATLLHEFGHVTGLGHSDDEEAVMAAGRRPDLPPPDSYDDSDLAGFAVLADAAGCAPPSRNATRTSSRPGRSSASPTGAPT